MKKILSLILCITVLIGAVLSVNISASAASLEYIKQDEENHLTWSAKEEKVVYLTVDETGYYDITIKDNKCTARLGFEMGDLDSEEDWYSSYISSSYNIPFNEMDTDEETNKNTYLIQGHLYQISFSYFAWDEEYDGDIIFSVIKNDYETINLTLGKSKRLILGNNSIDWLAFKTEATGDYIFEFKQYLENFGFIIIDQSAGVFLNTNTYPGKNRIKLDGNKEYLIYMGCWEESTKLYDFTVSKASANVAKIDVVSNFKIYTSDIEVYDVDGAYFEYYDKYDFNYKVTFSNKTTKTGDVYDLEDEGIHINIDYDGKIYEYKYEYIPASGYQPVNIHYMNGQVSTSKIYITGYVEQFSYLGCVTDYEDMTINYEDNDYYTYYWRIKPDQTNSYEFYSYDWDEIDSEITVFDKNNKPIPRNDGWYLKGGQEYCLRISYYYYDDCYYDVDFTLEPNRDHDHTYKWSTTKKATYFATGKKVYKCTGCGNVSKTKSIAKLKLPKSTVTYKAGSKKITVKYKKIADSKGFQVRYRLTTSKTWKTVTFNTTKSATKYLKSLKKNKKYYLQARAFTKSGSKKVYSDWMPRKTIKVK